MTDFSFYGELLLQHVLGEGVPNADVNSKHMNLMPVCGVSLANRSRAFCRAARWLCVASQPVWSALCRSHTMSSSWTLSWPAVPSLRSARCFWARVARFRASLSTLACCFSLASCSVRRSISAFCWLAARSRFWTNRKDETEDCSCTLNVCASYLNSSSEILATMTKALKLNLTRKITWIQTTVDNYTWWHVLGQMDHYHD